MRQRRVHLAARRTAALVLALAVVPALAVSGGTASQAADLTVTGSWQIEPNTLPIVGIHTSLMHTGEVLVMAGSENSSANASAGSFRSVTWNPATGVITPVGTPSDVFCSGHVQLPDGRLLVAGGVSSYPTADHYFYGSKTAVAYDPVTKTYSPLPDMAGGRWYPSLVELGSGDVLAMGGLADSPLPYTDNRTPEVFSSTTNTWRSLPSSAFQWPLYPHLLLMNNGKILFTGGNVFGSPIGAGVLDVESNLLTPVSGLSAPDQRDQSASVLLAPAQRQRFMVIGGGAPGDGGAAVANVDRINMASATPAYQQGPNLAVPRVHVTAVLLPDRKVFVTGGAQATNTGLPDYTTSIYDPSTNAWTDAATNQVARLYHSSGLLLPDGRVATFGSQVGNNPYAPQSARELRIEVFSPPYMFRPARPTITSAPVSVRYGSTFNIGVKSRYGVASASLIKPSAVTHSFDSSQRVVDLPVTAAFDGQRVTVTVPRNHNVAPPGFYMLFVNDKRRVPTVAAWVQLT